MKGDAWVLKKFMQRVDNIPKWVIIILNTLALILIAIQFFFTNQIFQMLASGNKSLGGAISWTLLLIWGPSFFYSSVFSITTVLIKKDGFSWVTLILNFLSLLILILGWKNRDWLVLLYN